MNSFEKYEKISRKNQSALCIGLDTTPEKLPGHFSRDIDSMLRFNREIIEATKDVAAAYKMNFAFYEQFGAPGFEILKKTFEIIPGGIFTIADAKRGDIGNTSAAYAKSVFDYFGADSITVSPYMGAESVEPFFEFEGKTVFVLARTSNPGADEIQLIETQEGPVYQKVVKKYAKYGKQAGFVAGATNPGELGEIRKIAPENLLLIPGIGAQGGDLAKVLESNSGGPCLINSSRGIIYASNGKDFAEKARNKAIETREAINALF
jgi:orotidine-5'-phosphate decarboxylase